MNLIPCSENCLYQSEGYCNLGTPTQIASDRVHGCVYYREKNTARPKPAVKKEF